MAPRTARTAGPNLSSAARRGKVAPAERPTEVSSCWLSSLGRMNAQSDLFPGTPVSHPPAQAQGRHAASVHGPVTPSGFPPPLPQGADDSTTCRGGYGVSEMAQKPQARCLTRSRPARSQWPCQNRPSHTLAGPRTRHGSRGCRSCPRRPGLPPGTARAPNRHCLPAGLKETPKVTSASGKNRDTILPNKAECLPGEKPQLQNRQLPTHRDAGYCGSSFLGTPILLHRQPRVTTEHRSPRLGRGSPEAQAPLFPRALSGWGDHRDT